MCLNNNGLKRRLCCYLIDQLLWFLHPVFLSLRVVYLQIANEIMLKLQDIKDDRYWKNLEKQKRLIFYLNKYKKMELSLETMFQITGKIILLALVYSQTRTTQGLITVFREKSDTIPAEIVITISLLISFTTFTLSQIAGVSGSRQYFPLKSKFFIGSSALLASLIRITCFVLYFSPSLGLWNLLRHYQG